MKATGPKVSMKGIYKRLGTAQALDNAAFEAKPGSINAIIGENGAGKTTLMKILFGLLSPDKGEILLDGSLLPRSHKPRDAIALGMGIVQQHFSLVPVFTVLENIVIGNEPRKGTKIDFEEARIRVSKIFDDLGASIDLNSEISGLSVSQRQMVEICRMLFTGARLLIFDEPTASLAPQEAERLYELQRRLTAEGATIILITHRLAEVIRYADFVTVLRRGRVTAHFNRGEMDEDGLITAMIPEAQKGVEKKLVEVDFDSPPVLALRDVSCPGEDSEILSGVNLAVRHGEILGIAGVSGSGQIELAETILGLRTASHGEIKLDDRDIGRLDTAARRRLGLVYIPEDRFADGIIPPFSMVHNRLLGDHRRKEFRSGGRYRSVVLRDNVRRKIGNYQIAADNVEMPLSALSGGNQQKLMLARELDRMPKVVVAQGPTRGLDVAASRRCYDILLRLCAGGSAVILFSTELQDLLTYSHRIAVVFGGRLLHAGSSTALDARRVGLLMTRGEEPSSHEVRP